MPHRDGTGPRWAQRQPTANQEPLPAEAVGAEPDQAAPRPGCRGQGGTGRGLGRGHGRGFGCGRRRWSN